MAMLLLLLAECPHALPVPRPQSSRAALCCPAPSLQPARPASLALRGSLPLAIFTSLFRPSLCTPFRPPKGPRSRFLPSCAPVHLPGLDPGQRDSLAAKTCRSKPFYPGPDASWLPPATGPIHAEHPLPCLCPTCLFGRGGQASPSVVAISQPIVIKALFFLSYRAAALPLRTGPPERKLDTRWSATFPINPSTHRLPTRPPEPPSMAGSLSDRTFAKTDMDT